MPHINKMDPNHSKDVFTISENSLMSSLPSHDTVRDGCDEKMPNSTQLSALMDKIISYTQSIYCLTESVRKVHSGHNPWHVLALTLDRLFLCLYLLLLVGVGGVMLLRYVVFGQQLEDWTEEWTMPHVHLYDCLLLKYICNAVSRMCFCVLVSAKMLRN